MLKKKISRIALVLMCILSLMMPYASTVFAAVETTVKQEDTTANLQVLTMHQGGEEASGTLTEEQKKFYDENPYGYQVGTTRVYKIVSEDDVNYTNAFYCLNGEKVFPGVTAEGFDSLEFTNVAKLKDVSNLNVKALHMSTSYADDSETWNANYNALIWLINNMYLPKQTPEQKDSYLTKAFADYEDYELDVVKAFLTDDDIDVVQQYAIWYFTNGDTEKYRPEVLPAITLTDIQLQTGSYKDITGFEYRQSMANHLYQYLIKSAKEGKTDSVQYPSITETGAKVSENEEHFIIGPLNIASGTVSDTEFEIKLLDQNDTEIPREQYQIFIDGEENPTDKNINELFDINYYIYIPKTNEDITDIVLVLTKYEAEATLWENNTTDEDGNKIYQPVTLITKEEKEYSKIPFKIERKTADLALRKYIVKINDQQIDRAPKVEIETLKNKTSQTAVYKHAKNPIVVSTGDKILYEIRVYNEDGIDAKDTVIIDALPKGLEFVDAEQSEINKTYGWEKISTAENVDVYLTNYLKDTTIKAFDAENGTTLDSAYVQMECKVTTDATASAVLTNIAEIANDGIEDRDSIPSNNDYTQKDYDSSNYTGNNINKDDLTDSNYYYLGREDDDDFEKVRVVGKKFDLRLKKFISKVNSVEKDRTPVVDVTNLKNETKTDATYTMTKTPVVVKQGDIVIYTVRVYNEGEIQGYAEIVTDYLPEGLGFLVNHKLNIDNYWDVKDKENLDYEKIIDLKDVKNGTENLTVNDFDNIDKLEDVKIYAGPISMISTKLKSSDVDNKNLIDDFDAQNDTTLDYKDIQIACIVLADAVVNDNLRNIAEITEDSDENRKTIKDIDSEPNTVNPNEYPGDDQNQDDNDYERLTIEEPKDFDLSLQKFITGVNGSKVEGREPKVVLEDGTVKVVRNNQLEALQVENGDVITYTIRVYNEGELAGYATEISDDLPAGLEFLPDNDTNKKYGWKLYDKNGNETTDLSQAVTVRTDYLSKEKSEARKDDSLIKPVREETIIRNYFDYRDVQIVFRVDENKVTTEARTIINTAQISDDEDEDGNSVDDIDSVPDNDKKDEDDIDTESVKVKYFDLKLRKDLVKIIITENGTTREISLTEADGLQKVEIHRKRINSTIVKFVYNITVTNEGQIEGYASEIKDYIPEGLEFIAAENPKWVQVSDKVITTKALENTLLKPGESASVQVVLKWINDENNLDYKVNTAEISKDKNDSNTPDIDSTPDNKKDGEDDIDTAEVFLTISTGIGRTYTFLALTILIIMTTGIALIKKYVLI